MEEERCKTREGCKASLPCRPRTFGAGGCFNPVVVLSWLRDSPKRFGFVESFFIKTVPSSIAAPSTSVSHCGSGVATSRVRFAARALQMDRAYAWHVLGVLLSQYHFIAQALNAVQDLEEREEVPHC